MAKVYFGCSMRGGRANVSGGELAALAGAIKSLGLELASAHQTEKNILEMEKKLSPQEIHDRDYRWIKESHFGVFEISNPSLGVGAEIVDMLELKKPVLCLFKKELEENVSAYLRGKEGSSFAGAPIECRAYQTLAEAKQTIKSFAAAHSNN